ncbi:MAG: DUF2207 domain-containing protein [Candidatus Roizmanbacteria bacterium]|nr:DUF2207 domain-containing protein [Candidatus Roizmanbacteria bacterium]
MKRTITSLIALTLFLFLNSSIHAEIIRGYDSQITIQKDGRIQVKEKIDYDFEDVYGHGITRDIPVIKKNSDGKLYELTVQVESVKDEKGITYNYSSSRVDNDLHLTIGDAHRTITGLHTYIINYLVSGALTYYSDHDELYWNSTGYAEKFSIENANSTVHFPEGVQTEGVKTLCYTGVAGSTAKDCTVQTEQNSTSVSAPRLENGSGLTIIVSFPKGSVEILEPKPYTAFENTWYGKIIFGIIFTILGILAFIWYIGLPIYIPFKWYWSGRDPRSQAVRVWYDPPQANGRPLTPAETGSLADETVDMKDIFGSLIQLAQKGYFQIVEEKKGDFKFVKKNDWSGDKKLMIFEKELLNGLFNGKDECKLKGRDLSTAMQKVTDSLYDQIVSDGFFKTNPQSTRTKYFALAGVALFTGNMCLAFVAFVFAKFMPAKTTEGAQQAGIGNSLKTFLTSQERQLEFQAKNQMMFEKLLPYAVVFGVEKIWADRFKDINLTQPSWYTGQNNAAFNAVYFSNSLHSSVSTFSYSATPTRSSSGFSSGFSSGGGFSGGGGGGGSVGSW